MAVLANGNGHTLEARQVSVRFEGLTAVDSVDETLRQGEILGLIGPNGAGKTTLVNAMTGFQLPASGEVLLAGKVISRLTPHWIRSAPLRSTVRYRPSSNRRKSRRSRI